MTTTWPLCRTCKQHWDPLCQNYRDDCLPETMPVTPTPYERLLAAAKRLKSAYDDDQWDHMDHFWSACFEVMKLAEEA